MHKIVITSDVSGEELGFGREQVDFLLCEIRDLLQRRVDDPDFVEGGFFSVLWEEDGTNMTLDVIQKE